MPPDEINGNGENKEDEENVYQKSGGPGKNPENQEESSVQLHVRQDDGNDIDGIIGKEIVPVKNFCKMSGVDDFVITGKNKYRSDDPSYACFHPPRSGHHINWVR
jgi:hypothetical protein